MGRAAGLAALAAALAWSPAGAQPTINGNNGTHRGDCRGGDAVVNGNANRVALTGYCRKVTVLGNGNRLSVDMTSGGHIAVPGNNNQIEYRLPVGGTEPEQTLLGNRNEVRLLPGESPPPRRGSR